MSTDQSSQHPLNPGPAGHSLWMIRENLDNLPRWTFPPGYTMRPMGPGDEKLWDEIQKETEPYFTIEPGYFLEQFGDDLKTAWQRVFLVLEPGGHEVGTIGAWYRRFEQKYYGLIHWVAIRPAFQRLGLAKASLTGTLEVLSRHYDRAYLETQSKRLPAISLYLDAGFRPHYATNQEREIWSELALGMTNPTRRNHLEKLISHKDRQVL